MSDDQVPSHVIDPICIVSFENTSKVTYFILEIGLDTHTLRIFWHDAIELKEGAGYLMGKADFEKHVLPLIEKSDEYELVDEVV